MNVGDRIKHLRKSNSLNQKLFSEQIGISQGTLSDIESGKCNPSFETILALKRTFDCDLDWLLLSGIDKKDNDLLSSLVSQNELELIEGYRELSAEDKEEFEKILQMKLIKNKK